MTADTGESGRMGGIPAGIPLEIPLFPLNTVLFPGGWLPLRIFEQRYLDMVKGCLRDSTAFGACLIREGHEVGQPALPYAIGCLARIEQWDVPHPNLFAILARGETRFRIVDTRVGAHGLITGHVEALPDPTRPDTIDAACREVLRLAIERAGTVNMPGPVQLDDPVWVSYRLAEILPMASPEKQALLEMTDTRERLEHLHALMLAQGIIEKYQ